MKVSLFMSFRQDFELCWIYYLLMGVKPSYFLLSLIASFLSKLLDNIYVVVEALSATCSFSPYVVLFFDTCNFVLADSELVEFDITHLVARIHLVVLLRVDRFLYMLSLVDFVLLLRRIPSLILATPQFSFPHQFLCNPWYCIVGLDTAKLY